MGTLERTKKLGEERHKLEKLDEKILLLLIERMKRISKIAKLKSALKMPIIQTHLWNSKIHQLIQKYLSKKKNQKFITSTFALKLFTLIHKESIAYQKRIKKL